MSLKSLLSNKRIVIGAVVMLVVISAIIGGTVAYFSDTEVSIGNTFKAGKFNLKIDNTCVYNGKECKINPQTSNYEWADTGEECYCTWSLADILQNQLFFNLLDVKPGDSGEDTISFHIDNNDAWLCAEIFNLQNNENGCDTPENKIDTTCHYLGNEGELGQNLFFTIWKDNGAGEHSCNNILDNDETPILVDQPAEAGIWPIADSTIGTGPIPGGTTLCYGIKWYVPLSTSNIIQSDALIGSLKFTAVQSRHMDTFKCSDLVPTDCVPITEICGNGIDEDCNGSDLACPPAECTTVLDCDDNNLCTEEAVCDNGVCIRTPLPCSDGNTCTTDTCDPLLGCQHVIPQEVCNGLDDDCDSQIDEQGAIGCQTYVYDGDADNYGVTGVQACLCSAEGYFTSLGIGGDCNDNDAQINPDAVEICTDGKDNDCDGYTDCADADCVNDASCQQALACIAAEEIFCGVPENGNTADSGSADIINAYSCTNWNETGREYVYSFSSGGANRNVTLGLSYMNADLDIFILEGDCAPGSCVAFDGNTANFIAEAGKTYYFSVDGNNGAQGSYTITANCQ